MTSGSLSNSGSATTSTPLIAAAAAKSSSLPRLEVATKIQSFDISGLENGAPGRSRTYNPQIRSLMLYPLSYGRLKRETDATEGRGNCASFKNIHDEFRRHKAKSPSALASDRTQGAIRLWSAKSSTQFLHLAAKDTRTFLRVNSLNAVFSAVARLANDLLYWQADEVAQHEGRLEKELRPEVSPTPFMHLSSFVSLQSFLP
jgi:hypothetical protein